MLITGETGTGKELVARAIHNCSARGLLPFIKVTARPFPRPCWNRRCSARPRGVYQRHGHEEGEVRAGAPRLDLSRRDRLDGRHASGEAVARPAGTGNRAAWRERSEHVDVRVIAATNRDFASWWKRDGFRTTCFIGCTSFRLMCRRSANASTTSRCSSSTSFASTPCDAEADRCNRGRRDGVAHGL